MLVKLKEHILKKSLFSESDRLLLAVSGGIDSMVMLHLFQQLPYSFEVAHMNFGLRNEESDADEQFLVDYCEKNKIRLHCKKVETLDHSKSARISIQMAARELRYQWFDELKLKFGFKHLITAHHSDDSIETIFINIIRGTGLRGLRGIVNNEQAIRPLLIFNRDDIEKYVQNYNILWREDSSNATTKYLRNKLRHTILPQFDELNNSWRLGFMQLAEDVSTSEKILDDFYQKHKNEIFVDNKIWLDKLEKSKHSAYIIRRLLSDFNFSHATIDDIIENLDIQKGKEYESWSHRLIREIDFFDVIEKSEQQPGDDFRYVLNTDQRLYINEKIYDLSIENKLDIDLQFIKGDAYLDYNKLDFPLLLRKWQAGDWFVPLGMKGRKKLSDYFVDEKFTIQEKENTFVLVSSENIVCILGHRTDERYRVGDNTKIIYHINRQHG